MEVSLKLNSSLALGVAAGVALGAAVAMHLASSKNAAAWCPAFWGDKSNKSSGIGNKNECCKTASASSSLLSTKPAAKVPVPIVDGDLDLDVETEAAERASMWYHENNNENFSIHLTLKGMLFDGRSSFQQVQVIETHQFGRTLVMDGQTQSAITDEFIYHESLVHPAMLIHKAGAKKVFIGGGGEFATAREVMRHKSVEKCLMVDIDKLACDICREHLPEWNAGTYEDPRFSIEYTDAFAWLKEHDEKYDVIFMDICDPIEAGPGYKLYTSEFYSFLVKERLNPGGIFVTQSGPCASYNAKRECFTTIHKTLCSSNFDVVLPYAVDVPSFGSEWGFNLAFCIDQGEDAVVAKNAVLDFDLATMDQLVTERITGGAKSLRYLDSIAFRGLFGIGKEIRAQCDEEDRVMTIDNPVFMYNA